MRAAQSQACAPPAARPPIATVYPPSFCQRKPRPKGQPPRPHPCHTRPGRPDNYLLAAEHMRPSGGARRPAFSTTVSRNAATTSPRPPVAQPSTSPGGTLETEAAGPRQHAPRPSVAPARPPDFCIRFPPPPVPFVAQKSRPRPAPRRPWPVVPVDSFLPDFICPPRALATWPGPCARAKPAIRPPRLLDELGDGRGTPTAKLPTARDAAAWGLSGALALNLYLQ